MSEILQLDRHTADLIAAGEVVERPASVVKELMENAFDAGASHITVEIRSGGMSYIRVTDDGKGIEPEDVETAFLRHATSKLRDARGLEAIATLGFRGEALAAISAVSRIEMLTCRKGAEEGRRVTNEGGIVRSNEPFGCPEGTTMIVKDLFYNTPARLKFMKTDRAEGSAVTGVVTRLALSHPEISVKYIREGKTELQTPGDGKTDSCVYHLFGRDFFRDLLPVTIDDGSVSVSGYVSVPAAAKGNRSGQYFFVNGRSIQSKSLQAALEQAYRNTLFTGKYPACILFIQISCGSVDVNVHPTKNEVKFSNGKAVFDAVYYGTLGALERKAPKISSSYEELPDDSVPAEETTDSPKPVPDSLASSSRGQSSVQTGSVEPRKNAFQSITADQFLKKANRSSSGFYSSGSSDRSPLPLPVRNDKAVFHSSSKQSKTDSKKSLGVLPEFSKKNLFEEALPTAAVQSDSPKLQASSELPGQEILPVSDAASWRVIGEALQTYIVVESGNSLWLIDKHAAHERIHFDRLKAQVQETMVQPLLVPIICRLSAEDVSIVLENTEYLEKLGFQAEAFGHDSLALRQIPSHIDTSDAENAISEICTILKQGGESAADDGRDRILHSIACKAAIKAGKTSDPKELEVIAKRVMSGEIRYCPHGRPVAIELTKSSLDKSFKRI